MREKSVKAASETAKDAMPMGTEAVSLVEYERAILDLGKAFLNILGYEVLAAATPTEAIRLVGKNRQGHRSCDH